MYTHTAPPKYRHVYTHPHTTQRTVQWILAYSEWCNHLSFLNIYSCSVLESLSTHVEVRRQRSGIGSVLPPCGLGDWWTIFGHNLYLTYFWDKVLLHNPGWPGWRLPVSIDEASVCSSQDHSLHNMSDCFEAEHPELLNSSNQEDMVHRAYYIHLRTYTIEHVDSGCGLWSVIPQDLYTLFLLYE